MADGREGGFIKLHRRIKSWPLYRSMTGAERNVVSEILMLANWKADEFWYGTHRIAVKRGQLAHSLQTIADEAAASVKVVRLTIAKLKTEGFLTEEYPLGEGRGPRVLTVVNYEQYQGIPAEEGTPRDTGRASLGHGEGTPRALREEGEEGKTSGDPLAEWRRGVAEALCVMGSNPLRIADGARAKAMRVDIATLGVGPAIDIATEAARDAGKVPGTADWFAPVLRRAAEQGPTPPSRGPLECPNPGDPDFNDQNAYPTYEAYLNRGRAHA